MMNEQRFYREIEAHFNLRTNKTKKPEMVYLVVRIDGRQFKLSCGVKVYPSQWRKGVAEESNLLCKRDNRNNHIANEKITEIKKRYSEFISYLCGCDNDITDMSGLLKQFIYKDMAKEKNAVEYINEAFENCYKSRKAKAQTKNDCKRKIEKYFIPYVEKQKDKSINILRQEGFSKWAKWLTDKATPIVANDTLQLIARLIKQITIDYPRLGLSMPTYNKVQVEKNTQKKNEGKPLTKAEVEALEKYEPKNDTQKATKILFLIGIETGARSSDWNKFIEGNYERKEIDGKTILIIHPQKTERKEGNDAYVTLTPKLEKLIKEAREMDIFYVDRDKNDKLEDKGRSHKTRVIASTFVYNLRKICETINKNTSGELFGRQKLVVGGETKPTYQAISSHWARHTFVHECKLKSMKNETIAKKIGDSVAMVEQNYGFMDKEEIAEQVLKAEEEAKKEGTLEVQTVSNDARNKTSLINAFFAYDDVVSLMDMQVSGISIYDDARLKKAISIIKKSVTKATIDKATRLFKDADKDTVALFKKNVASIDSFIWNVGKHFADTKLYMMYQYKQNKLGLLEKKPLDEETLDAIWQQELANAERENCGM